MTVSSTTTKNSYSGNGSTTVFAYTFKIFDDDDITVIIRTDSTGAEVVKTKTTHYTVSGVGSSSGGNVTFTSGNTPASGETVLLIRTTAQTQLTDYTPNDPFPAASHEDALDKVTFIAQELQEELGRSIKISKSNTITSSEFTTSAAARANKVLGFDGSGDLTVTASVDDISKDTTPQLGGNLDVNGNSIVSTSNGNIDITPNGTGEVNISKVDINAGAIDGTVIGANSAESGKFTAVTVDNLKLNASTLSSINTNGDINLTPDGTGEVNIPKVDIDSGAIDGTVIGASSADSGTFTTLSATTLGSAVDLNNQALTNANIDSGAVDGITLGTNSAVTEAQIDNININGNSITSTNSNGNITIDPNGAGNVSIGNFTFDADQTVGSGQNDFVLKYDDTSGLISLEATGGGVGLSDVVDDTSPQLGGNLDVNGNSIISASNGNIAITPDGTGEVDISKVDIDSGAIDGVTLGTNSAVTEAQIDNININGNTVSSTNTDGDITLDPNGTGHVVIPADIGMGTTSPAARIHIEDSTPTIRLEDTGANGHVQLSANNTRGGLTIQLDPDNVDSSTDLRVDVDGSEIVRVTSDGLLFNGDSAAANALDDYEEGTWTLTPQTNSGTAASIGTESGIYTKVGRLVTIIGVATNITKGNDDTGIFRIGGLPFSPANEHSLGSAIWHNISFQGASTRFYFAPRARTAGYIEFTQSGEDNADTATVHGDLDAGNTSDIEFTVTYMV